MMIHRIFNWLPGPLPVRIIESAIIIVALLIGLHLFYTWLGIFLDPGGAVG